jgi:single-strand DNA-binding protein
MQYDTAVTLVGNVGSDLRAASTASGKAVASFRLASGQRRRERDGDGWVDDGTGWFDVTCFGVLAQNALMSLAKGQPVVVHGTMRVREWTNDEGRSGRELEITATYVGHDLRRGRSTFARIKREDDHAGRQPSEVEGVAPTEHPDRATVAA